MDPRFPNYTTTIQISGTQLGGTSPTDITDTWRNWISGDYTPEMLAEAMWTGVRWTDSTGVEVSSPTQEALDILDLLDDPSYQHVIVQHHAGGSTSRERVYIYLAGVPKEATMFYDESSDQWYIDATSAADPLYRIMMEMYRAPGFGPSRLRVRSYVTWSYEVVSGGTTPPYYKIFENNWDNIVYPSGWVGPPLPEHEITPGTVDVFDGSGFISAPVQVYDGSDWVDTEVLQWTGTQWQ